MSTADWENFYATTRIPKVPTYTPPKVTMPQLTLDSFAPQASSSSPNNDPVIRGLYDLLARDYTPESTLSDYIKANMDGLRKYESQILGLSDLLESGAAWKPAPIIGRGGVTTTDALYQAAQEAAGVKEARIRSMLQQPDNWARLKDAIDSLDAAGTDHKEFGAQLTVPDIIAQSGMYQQRHDKTDDYYIQRAQQFVGVDANGDYVLEFPKYQFNLGSAALGALGGAATWGIVGGLPGAAIGGLAGFLTSMMKPTQPPTSEAGIHQAEVNEKLSSIIQMGGMFNYFGERVKAVQDYFTNKEYHAQVDRDSARWASGGRTANPSELTPSEYMKWLTYGLGTNHDLVTDPYHNMSIWWQMLYAAPVGLIFDKNVSAFRGKQSVALTIKNKTFGTVKNVAEATRSKITGMLGDLEKPIQRDALATMEVTLAQQSAKRGFSPNAIRDVLDIFWDRNIDKVAPTVQSAIKDGMSSYHTIDEVMGNAFKTFGTRWSTELVDAEEVALYSYYTAILQNYAKVGEKTAAAFRKFNIVFSPDRPWADTAILPSNVYDSFGRSTASTIVVSYRGLPEMFGSKWQRIGKVLAAHEFVHHIDTKSGLWAQLEYRSGRNIFEEASNWTRILDNLDMFGLTVDDVKTLLSHEDFSTVGNISWKGLVELGFIDDAGKVLRKFNVSDELVRVTTRNMKKFTTRTLLQEFGKMHNKDLVALATKADTNATDINVMLNALEKGHLDGVGLREYQIAAAKGRGFKVEAIKSVNPNDLVRPMYLAYKSPKVIKEIRSIIREPMAPIEMQVRTLMTLGHNDAEIAAYLLTQWSGADAIRASINNLPKYDLVISGIKQVEKAVQPLKTVFMDREIRQLIGADAGEFPLKKLLAQPDMYPYVEDIIKRKMPSALPMWDDFLDAVSNARDVGWGELALVQHFRHDKELWNPNMAIAAVAESQNTMGVITKIIGGRVFPTTTEWQVVRAAQEVKFQSKELAAAFKRAGFGAEDAKVFTRMGIHEYWMRFATPERVLGHAPRWNNPLKLIKDAVRLEARLKDQLEAIGYNLRSELWSARNPFKIKDGVIQVAPNYAIGRNFGRVPIKPLTAKASMAVADVFEMGMNHPEKFAKLYEVTPEALKFIRAYRRSVELAIRFAKNRGILYEEAPEFWFGRNVIGNADVTLERAHGFFSGFSDLKNKPRFYALMQDGMEAGVQYTGTDPIESFDLMWRGITNRVARKNSAELISSLGQKPAAKVIEGIRKGRPMGANVKNIAGVGVQEYRNFKLATGEVISGEQIGSAIEKAFNTKVSGVLSAANFAAAFPKSFKAALDNSWLLINMLPNMARHPLITAKLLGESIVNWTVDTHFFEKQLANPANLEAAAQLAYHGGLLSPTEFAAAAGDMTRIFNKIPGVGQYLGKASELTFGRANLVFSGARNMAAVELWKALRTSAKSEGELRGLANFINCSTGMFSLRGAGVDSSKAAALGAFALFAPRYNAAMASNLFYLPKYALYDMVKDQVGITKKLATLNKLKAAANPNSQLIKAAEETLSIARETAKGNLLRARYTMENWISMAIGGTLLYTGVCAAIGQTPYYNPLDEKYGGDGSKAFSITVGGTRMSLMVGMLSVMRHLANATVGYAKGDTAGATSHLTRMVSGRASMLTSSITDLWTGKDFLGYPIEKTPKGVAGYLGQQFIPIWAQSTIEAQQRGEKPGIVAATALAEFQGGSTYQEPYWSKVDSLRAGAMEQALKGQLQIDPWSSWQKQIIDEQGGLKWENLTSGQQAQIRRLMPDLVAAEDVARKDTAQRYGDKVETEWGNIYEEVRDERNDRLTDVTNRFLSGKLTSQDYLDLRSEARSAYSEQAQVLLRLRDRLGWSETDAWTAAQRFTSPEDAAMDKYWEVRNTPVIDPETGEENIGAMVDAANVYLASLPKEQQDYINKHKTDWILDLPTQVQAIERKWIDDSEMLNKIGYYDMSSETRLLKRHENPNLDATLAFWGKITVCRSDQALDALYNMATSVGRSPASIEAITKTASPIDKYLQMLNVWSQPPEYEDYWKMLGTGAGVKVGAWSDWSRPKRRQAIGATL